MRSFHRAVNTKIGNDYSSKSALASRKEIAEDGQLKFVHYNDSLITSVNGVKLGDAEAKLISYNKYFEAAISISILDKPGKIANVLDDYTLLLADVLDNVVNNEQKVTFNNTIITLFEVFKRTTFNTMSNGSDQIGRMPAGISEETPQWLIQQLKKSLAQNNNFLLMLTKMKAISSFGTTVWQLLTVSDPERRSDNTQVVANLLISAGCFPDGHSASQYLNLLNTRFSEFTLKTRSERFDSPISRARSERMPLINKNENIKFDGIYTNAANHGLGFGQVVQHASTTEKTQLLRDYLDNAASGNPIRNSRINAIDRFGAPIGDLNRPFMLSDSEFNNLPDELTDLNLKQKIESHYFKHGVGINRWQPYGTYSIDSNNFGYPSAGAQSGGATDILLAMIILGIKRESIYGNIKSVIPMTLAAAAFMNFGGYHTFAEVLPIVEAVAQNQVFDPAKIADVLRYGSIYSQMLVLYCGFGNAQEAVNLQRFELKHRKLTQQIRDELFYRQENDW